MARAPYISIVLVAVLAFLTTRLYPGAKTKATVFGLTRPRDGIVKIHGEKLIHIPDTLYCEDVHYHESFNKLFTACETVRDKRRKWFPPLGLLDYKHADTTGALVMIDPEVSRSKHLRLGPTHKSNRHLPPRT